MSENSSLPEEEPLWYKDAVIYEVHVRSFADSNGDGIGDFGGLRDKLGYLEELGATAIWLLPFYPSPLRDDGYDIADYLNVNPDYGTLGDFRNFLREAHRRGIRVITELVLNHTSDQHAWFRRSRRAKPGSRYRDFYVWSDTPERYADARIIFKDFEPSNWAWDATAGSYYWHRFYSHQPDLNFDNPEVHKALLRVIDFWFGMGVDGLRLDAVPYLCEREGTNCENLPETHAFLKKLRKHVDRKYSDRMLLAEANQWPEDAAVYFGDGDECHMAFHFPLMPRMFMAAQMEDRFPILDILEQTPSIPETCQWALFLRNHDELTLEMVTDEERDYMYRMYARDRKARINLGIRRRLAPLNENDRRRIELMNVLLFTLPGTPVLYYGDEIGMGDNYYLGDRNGVRTPMQWSSDRNSGFSRANPQQLYLPVVIDPEYHAEALNVENQERNPHSLLWWTRRLISARKNYRAFGRGSLEFLMPENPKVLAFIRRYEDEHLLVVVNLSKYAQAVELDLTAYAGFIPEDVFSQNEFPAVKGSPYLLTLAPYGYHLFALREAREAVCLVEGELLDVRVEKRWTDVLSGKHKSVLERKVLPCYLEKRRWFAGKAKVIQKLAIAEDISLERDVDAHLLVIEVQYTDGPPEAYVLPVSYAIAGATVERPVRGKQVRQADLGWHSTRAQMLLEEAPESIIGRLLIDNEVGVLFDASYDAAFQHALLKMIAGRRKIRLKKGTLVAYPGKMFKRFLGGRELPLSSRVLKGEQSNTSIFYESNFFFKLYRRLYEGMNPDLETVRFLTQQTDFSNIPLFTGAVEYRRSGADPVVVGLLQGYVQSEGDAWTRALAEVEQYYERVLTLKDESACVPQLPASVHDLDYKESPECLRILMGGVFPEMAAILGKRTGELHLALASARENADFTPEPFSLLYQRSVYQSLRSLKARTLQTLRKNLKSLPEPVAGEARAVLDAEKEILGRFGGLLRKKLSAMKMRFHGDYHLGQVLYAGNDFIIIDFEGEPARPISERWIKRSPLVDVAGMLRSFFYASHVALMQHSRPEDVPALEAWATPWYLAAGSIFIRSYFGTVEGAFFMPKEEGEARLLLDIYTLEKALYEVGYELNSRPDWAVIPLRGIRHILGHGGEDGS